MISNKKGKFPAKKLREDEKYLTPGLKAFYKEARKYPLLTRKEEQEWSSPIQWTIY